MSLSSRAAATQKSENRVEYFDKSMEAWTDSYDSETNPQGYINLAVAENKLSSPLLASRLSRLPPIPPSTLSYTSALGARHAREVVASFFQRYITKTPVLSDHIVLANGASSVISILSTLICDVGDHIIVCGPGYRGLKEQMATYAGVKITVAHLDIDLASINNDSTAKFTGANCRFPPLHSIDHLQNALDRARVQGHNVRAVIICSPHNPTGEILSCEMLRDIVSWARKNEIHAIIDELYALSVHDENMTHTSVAQVLNGDLGQDVHIVWSMSKDLCASGIRLGVLYSQNEKLIAGFDGMYGVLAFPSRLVEWSIVNILSDFDWLDDFFEKNRGHLRYAYQTSVKALSDMNIPFTPGGAGFFLLIDMRKFITDNSATAEMNLWRKMCDHKILMTPSSEFYNEKFGFFRVCFAAVQPDALSLMWVKLRALLDI